jgi:hypothetical protein
VYITSVAVLERAMSDSVAVEVLIMRSSGNKTDLLFEVLSKSGPVRIVYLASRTDGSRRLKSIDGRRER